MKKIAAFALVGILIICLAGCSNNGESSSEEKTPATGTTDSETDTTDRDEEKSDQTNSEEPSNGEETEPTTVKPSEEEDEKTDAEPETNTLKENVTISDITFNEHETTNPVMGYDNIDYMVEMTVSNDNDVSCDVYPSLQATVVETNEYGDETSEEIHLLRSKSNMINSPYSRLFTRDSIKAEDNYDEYLIPIGLAPHETKNVVYYMDGAYVEGGGEFDFGAEGPIIDLKLLDYNVEEAPYTYINLSEALDNETGAVTNTTGERWRTVGANYEQVTNGSPDSSSKTEVEFYNNTGEYLDRDEDVILTDSDLYDAESQSGKVPVLMWYEVDSDYSDN